uniref:Uncharacterized protein n=1 Tax=Sphaerodactylus townsendi TaxID=933632 RepID=A0ACB8FKL9_9SAUR
MFLSQTSLWDVIWWKEELARCLQDQPYPFLPEIPDIRLSDIAAVDSDPQVVEEACAVPAGFYWQTVETDEKYFPGSSDMGESDDADAEVAMALLFETLLRNPMAVHHTFQLILASGLDICGLRLLYAPYDILLSSAVTLPPSYMPEKELPVLGLSLRGPNARAVLQNIMGPSDPRLASVTDSHSINAAYCTSRAQPLAYLPHTDSRVHRELCVWFGGRACCEERLRSGACPPACKRSKPRPSDLQEDTGQETSNLEDVVPCTAPATLVATTKGDIILVTSPAVPPCTYGRVISTCTQRGFVLQGVKQLRLSPKQAFSLGMPANQVAAFCPGEASGPLDGSCSGDSCPDQSQRHCLALLLRKENAYHHVPSLLKGLMNGLAEEGFLAKRQSSSSPGVGPEPGLSFHAAPYTDSLLQALGGSFCAVPDPCPIPLDILHSRRYASDPDMEQIVLLTLSGKEAMKTAGEFLHHILAVGHKKELQAPADSQIRDCAVLDGHDQEFELLALKWLPCLTRTQAKETTPFEVGDKLWHPSINTLVSSPALICALRGIGAFAGLAEILKTQTSPYSKPRANTSDLCRVMSSTPEMAYRQAILFFTRKDFIGDANHRLALRYLPPPVRCPQSKGGEIQTSSAESLFHFMQAGAEVFCTVLLIKPGMWARNLARILRKLDQERFRLVGMRHLNLSPEQAEALHSSEDEEVC